MRMLCCKLLYFHSQDRLPPLIRSQERIGLSLPIQLS
jgi:hypothetical protein